MTLGSDMENKTVGVEETSEWEKSLLPVPASDAPTNLKVLPGEELTAATPFSVQRSAVDLL